MRLELGKLKPPMIVLKGLVVVVVLYFECSSLLLLFQ